MECRGMHVSPSFLIMYHLIELSHARRKYCFVVVLVEPV